MKAAQNGATLKFSTSGMSIYTFLLKSRKFQSTFFHLFQLSPSLEEALFYGNYNACATCHSVKCQNARAVFNPPGILYEMYMLHVRKTLCGGFAKNSPETLVIISILFLEYSLKYFFNYMFSVHNYMFSVRNYLVSVHNYMFSVHNYMVSIHNYMVSVHSYMVSVRNIFRHCFPYTAICLKQ